MNIQPTQFLYYILFVSYIYMLYRWWPLTKPEESRSKYFKRVVVLTLIAAGLYLFSPINLTQPVEKRTVTFNQTFESSELTRSERVLYHERIQQELQTVVTAEEILNETKKEEKSND